jgi:hypothetical protein
MPTLKLVLTLVAVLVLGVPVLFFVPWALNAHDSILNTIGLAVPAAIVIGAIAVIHRKATQVKE